MVYFSINNTHQTGNNIAQEKSYSHIHKKKEKLLQLQFTLN